MTEHNINVAATKAALVAQTHAAGSLNVLRTGAKIGDMGLRLPTDSQQAGMEEFVVLELGYDPTTDELATQVWFTGDYSACVQRKQEMVMAAALEAATDAVKLGLSELSRAREIERTN